MARRKREVLAVMRGWRLYVGLLVCFTVGVVGCRAKSDRVDVYPVKGKVLVKGKPVEGVTIAFYAEVPAADGKKNPLPAGTSDANGEYYLTSYDPGDGAPAGSYKVVASWNEKRPANFTGGVFEPKDRLQGRFANPEKSTLKSQVPEGGGEIPAFDLK